MGSSIAKIGAELQFHFVNSAILTALVSLVVLWRYRRAVLEGMRGETAPLPLPAPVRTDPEALPAEEAKAWLQVERSLGRRIALAYWLTTLTCGLPLAVGSVVLSGWQPGIAQILMLGLIYSFVSVPMVIVSLALPAGRAIWAFARFVLLMTVLAVAVALLQRGLAGRPIGWQHLRLVPLFLENAGRQLWMPALFWLLTWPPRLRGVAPITFAALLVFGLAPFAGSQLTDALTATRAGTPLVFNLGQSGVFLLLALPAGWFAWMRLHHLSRDYEAKHFSDAQLLARTWWLFLIASVGADLVIARQKPVAALLLCGAVLLLFAPVNHWWLVRLRGGMQPLPPRTLLLLRVFGYTARTERLFDHIGARWRLLGPVTMIAAPDVVARTIDPGDYLRWLTGRVADLFVTSRADLDARLAAFDGVPDPDGRYRINEFCCSRSTWQVTVVELMDRADAVVMDLRGVTRDRQGCAFELQQLSERLPLRRLVLVTDHSTDHTVLETAFRHKLPHVCIAEVERARDIRGVFASLLHAAG